MKFTSKEIITSQRQFSHNVGSKLKLLDESCASMHSERVNNANYLHRIRRWLTRKQCVSKGQTAEQHTQCGVLKVFDD